jgi:hypothetical protein
MANTYQLIESRILGTAAANVTFSAIPATYGDLVLRMSIRGTTTGSGLSTRIRWNSDSSSLYSITDLIGTGSTTLDNRYSNNTEVDTTRAGAGQANSNFTANTFTSIEVYLPKYTSTAPKPSSSISASENNSTTTWAIDNMAQLYRGTSAVSSVLIFPSAGSFAADSSFYLYGIKNS